MGVPFRIVLYAPDAQQAQAAAEAAFERIKQLNAILSDYEGDSELTRLTRTAGQGQEVQVSDDLWQVLKRSQALAARTQGAFDVTAGPYISLWRRTRRIFQLPIPERMVEAKKAVGYEKMILHERAHKVTLLAPKMRLDLGGIAKGYAVDQALTVLRTRGIKRALVAGSGDLAVGHPPPGQPGWRIEIAPHDAPNAPPQKFALLRNMALATSGDVFQHVEIEGKRYSHIIDPRTGRALTDHSLVTIIAPDCTTADSLATAVSVLGPGKGLPLIESTRGTAALITRKIGERVEQLHSRRFQQFLKAN